MDNELEDKVLHKLPLLCEKISLQASRRIRNALFVGHTTLIGNSRQP
jgi:hypothetical protein